MSTFLIFWLLGRYDAIVYDLMAYKLVSLMYMNVYGSFVKERSQNYFASFWNSFYLNLDPDLVGWCFWQVLSMSRLGGAGALPSLVNDMPAEVSKLPLSRCTTLEYCRWYHWFSSMSTFSSMFDY